MCEDFRHKNLELQRIRRLIFNATALFPEKKICGRFVDKGMQNPCGEVREKSLKWGKHNCPPGPEVPAQGTPCPPLTFSQQSQGAASDHKNKRLPLEIAPRLMLTRWLLLERKYNDSRCNSSVSVPRAPPNPENILICYDDGRFHCKCVRNESEGETKIETIFMFDFLQYEEECAHHHCADIYKKVEKCDESVKGKEGKNCLFHHAKFWECVDHCVCFFDSSFSPSLFSRHRRKSSLCSSEETWHHPRCAWISTYIFQIYWAACSGLNFNIPSSLWAVLKFVSFCFKTRDGLVYRSLVNRLWPPNKSLVCGGVD